MPALSPSKNASQDSPSKSDSSTDESICTSALLLVIGKRVQEIVNSGETDIVRLTTGVSGMEKCDKHALDQSSSILEGIGTIFKFKMPSQAKITASLAEIDNSHNFALTQGMAGKATKKAWYLYESQKLKMIAYHGVRHIARTSGQKHCKLNKARQIFEELRGNQEGEQTTIEEAFEKAKPPQNTEVSESDIEVSVSNMDIDDHALLISESDVEIIDTWDAPTVDIDVLNAMEVATIERGKKQRKAKAKAEAKRKAEKPKVKKAKAEAKRKAEKPKVKNAKARKKEAKVKPTIEKAEAQKATAADLTCNYQFSVRRMIERKQIIFQIRNLTTKKAMMQFTGLSLGGESKALGVAEHLVLCMQTNAWSLQDARLKRE